MNQDNIHLLWDRFKEAVTTTCNKKVVIFLLRSPKSRAEASNFDIAVLRSNGYS